MSSVTNASDNLLRNPADNRRRIASRADGEKWETGHANVGSRALHGISATGQYNFYSRKHRIATWNVRGLKETGKLSIINNELIRCKIDICGLTETHLTGHGHYSTTDFTVYFSGNENKSWEGVAILISNKLNKAVIGYQPINGRLMSIKLNTKPCIVNIFAIYAPTSAAPEEEVDQLYQILETHIGTIPNKEVCIIVGDFNAKVGSTTNDHHIRAVVGKYGLGERNERGERLIQFCIENKFTICNTVPKQHKRRLFTWRSPGGKHKNQIDYILVSTRWRSSIANAKTLPSADCGSDHQLLTSEFQTKFKSCIRPELGGVLCRNLPPDDNIGVVFKQELNFEILENQNLTSENIWTKMKTALIETVRKTKLPTTVRKKQPWISDETLNLCTNRRNIKKAGLDNPINRDKYKTLNRLIQKGCRKDKALYYENICREIENHANTNQTKDLFNKIKTITRNFKPKSHSIRDQNGRLQTDLNEVLKVWRDYCENLYKDVAKVNSAASDQLEPDILLSEVRDAVDRLKNDKAVGVDRIPAEIWKHLREECLPALHLLCQTIWRTAKWPTDWTTSIIIPIHKKGDTTNCDNYRLIALISHASKVMLNIIRSRLQHLTLHQIAPEQAGFVKNRGTREQILNVRMVIEKAREHYIPLYLCFVDFSKAFDNIKWETMWGVLQDMGVPKHLVTLIQELYKNSSAMVKIENFLSDKSSIEKGVRQGCVLSPLLFNLYSEHLMRLVLDDWEGGFKVGGKKISNLRFADDTLLVAGSEEEITTLLERLQSVSRDYGLELNRSKTKIMIIDREHENEPQLPEISNCEVVDKIMYLGSLIKNDGDCEAEIRRRIQLGRTAMSQLTKIWKDRNISIRTKKSLVKSLVFSVFWYASETWVIKTADRRRIDAFEMWCWRRLLRVPWTARRTNASILEEINPEHRLSSLTSARALKFFGHIMRHDNVERLMVQGMTEGKRRRGRSPTRWIDAIHKLTGSSLERATRESQNRLRWRQTINRIITTLDET